MFIIAGRAMQAMLAGQVPVGLVGGTHVVNANTGGGDFSMILGLENRLDYLFLAKPTIKSGEDLKGKKVGDRHAGRLRIVGDLCRPGSSWLGAAARQYCACSVVGGVPERMARFAFRQCRRDQSVSGNRPTGARRRLSRVGRPW